MYKFTLILILSIFNESWGETSMGKCIDVVPLSGFNMNRFLGKWYAIQTTGKHSPCISYYITPDPQKEGHYKITEIEQHTTIWSSALHHEHNITGDLTIPDQTKPGKMALDLPLDIGTTTFTVFMTDYDNYAAIFTCKKYPLLHSWGARILSRTRTLDMAFIDKVRTRLASYNLDPFELKIVSQNLCPKAGTKGSIVNTANKLVTGVRNTVYDVVGNVQGTVQSFISDPNIQNSEEQPDLNSEDGEEQYTTTKPIDVRLKLDDAQQKASGVISDLRDEATGVVNNIKGEASRVVVDAQEKWKDLASHSKDFVNDFEAKVADVTSDVEGKLSSINKN